LIKKKNLADISLLFVAFIWGTTFVVVQNAIATLPPYSFNGIRFTFASIILFMIILILYRDILKQINRQLLMSGVILGILLFLGYTAQTIGLLFTTASKAGFITGLSVVLVPIFSIIILKVYPKLTSVISMILAATGLYFLTAMGSNSFNLGDLLIFFCAIFFAMQIVFTGKFSPNYNSLILAWIQISVVAVLSLVFAIIFEDFTAIRPSGLFKFDVLIALLITSIFATALAFLAQTYFQKFTSPTRVAIIFAMEPVFASITAVVINNERLGIFSIVGGLLILLGMILAESEPRKSDGSLKQEMSQGTVL